MNSPYLPCARRVLIVDRSDESRDVLRTVLERRGIACLEAGEARAGLELARHHHPEVIVLDLEAEAADDQQICRGFADETRRSRSALVVLGSLSARRGHPSATREVSKPYHYGALIRTIEELCLPSRGGELGSP